MAGFKRYVALGDSQTEGLWDGDDVSGLVGFADRLAHELDRHYPGLCYANLAVRGHRIGDVLAHQLPRALAMTPDLVTICIGMNDVVRPGRSFDRALCDLARLYTALAGSGATVVTTTFPDITQILPVGRLLARRVKQINAAITSAADAHGFCLVDLYSAPSMEDELTWSPDRVHGSAVGHARFAAAAAEAIGLPGSNHDWATTYGPVQPQSLRSRAHAQALWTHNMLMPWIWRHLRGRSAGAGRAPRRPELMTLIA